MLICGVGPAGASSSGRSYFQVNSPEPMPTCQSPDTDNGDALNDPPSPSGPAVTANTTLLPLSRVGASNDSPWTAARSGASTVNRCLSWSFLVGNRRPSRLQ